MDKTVKINLGGSLFQIDEDAYRILRDYLQAIDSRFRNVAGGAETIEDIESRVAEIFQSQKGSVGVISVENVEAMISVLGKPGDFDVSEDEVITTSYSSERRRMYRNPNDSIIGGVCGGMGAYLNTDPVWFRILFVVTALFFFVGFFVYIALWIALPSADSDTKKKEMLAGRYRSGKASSEASRYSPGTYPDPGVGSAFNEVFRALGKAIYIIVRVFLIIIGVSFVFAGFLALVSCVMIFFFRYPGYFSTDAFGVNLFYLPDFLNYVVNPAVAPWIMLLLTLVVILPLLAMIYWGVKMIFWFRAKDGIISLAGLVLWVMSVAALSLILFNEGVSFAETARTSSREIIENPPEKLYIMGGQTVDALNYDKDISIPDENYSLYFRDDNKTLYINTQLSINSSEDKALKIEIMKRSAGRSKADARRKAESLIYNYQVSGDTLSLDEYFTFPPDSKWACDNVGVVLYIPEGTQVRFDESTSRMFRPNRYYDSDFDSDEFSGRTYSWIMTENGLKMSSDR
ncbi:MAG: PspC domain-containing protein [Bacteroidales bacterium]|nr:PspC domain-containing protein [Bacteroidales bacterium]